MLDGLAPTERLNAMSQLIAEKNFDELTEPGKRANIVKLTMMDGIWEELRAIREHLTDSSG